MNVKRTNELVSDYLSQPCCFLVAPPHRPQAPLSYFAEGLALSHLCAALPISQHRHTIRNQQMFAESTTLLLRFDDVE